MKEKDLIAQFNRDMDELLNVVGYEKAEAPSDDYQQLLDLAYTLATADLSVYSRKRQAIRNRLLDQLYAREARHSKKETLMRNIFSKRSFAIALVVLLLLAFAFPGVRSASAHAIDEFLKWIQVGEHTIVVQVDPDKVTPEALPEDEEGWTLITDIGTYRGALPLGSDAGLKYFDNLDETAKAIDHPLYQPEYLPADYAFYQSVVAPDRNQVFLFYKGPGRDIIVVQTFVGVVSEDSMFTVMTGIMTDCPIEDATVNGQTATWTACDDEGNILTWEAGEMSYEVGGVGLTLEEAIRVAESIK